MEFVLLIVEPPGQREQRSADEGREAFAAMLAYAETLRERGVLRGVAALARRATRVRRRDGGTHVVDGPFTEAKELVGGYFLVDAAGRHEALAIAAECPAAAWATVEVREVAPCYE